MEEGRGRRWRRGRKRWSARQAIGVSRAVPEGEERGARTSESKWVAAWEGEEAGSRSMRPPQCAGCSRPRTRPRPQRELESKVGGVEEGRGRVWEPEVTSQRRAEEREGRESRGRQARTLPQPQEASQAREGSGAEVGGVRLQRWSSPRKGPGSRRGRGGEGRGRGRDRSREPGEGIEAIREGKLASPGGGERGQGEAGEEQALEVGEGMAGGIVEGEVG